MQLLVNSCMKNLDRPRVIELKWDVPENVEYLTLEQEALDGQTDKWRLLVRHNHGLYRDRFEIMSSG